MLTGKYWILTEGQVVDTSTTEHAVLAREKVLELGADDPIRKKGPFYQLTATDWSRLRNRRGKSLQAIANTRLMREGADPRWLVIEQHRWIRVAKSAFWLWMLNHKTLERLRYAKAYWDAQKTITAHEIADVVELRSGNLYQIPVEKLRTGALEFDDLYRFKTKFSKDLIL